MGDTYTPKQQHVKLDTKTSDKPKIVSTAPFLRREQISDQMPIILEGVNVYFPYKEPYPQQKTYMEYVIRSLKDS